MTQNRMNPTRKRAAVLLVGLVVATAMVALFVVETPRIESVENEWGAVDADRSEVETAITVANPRLLRVGGGAVSVEYALTLNGIQFAAERTERVHLDSQTDTIRISTWVNNDRIPEWWVTHVNDDETSTVALDTTVGLGSGGVSVPVERWTRERTVRTDLLDPLRNDESRRFTAFDRTVFVVDETDARWGYATTERTPIDAAATVTNSLPVPLPITEIGYTIRMNDIVVGQGTAASPMVLPAGGTRTLDADASIDNSRLDEWWVTHLRNDETTTLSVSFFATVEFGGVERQLPLDFISYDRTFETDVFESGAVGNQSASVQRVGHDGYQRPAMGLARVES